MLFTRRTGDRSAHRVLTTIRIIALSLASIACSDNEGNRGWRKVGQSGLTHFVVVDAKRESDKAMYMTVAASLCPDRQKRCYILFWSRPERVPVKLPMSDLEALAMTASYTRNPSTQLEQLMLNCRFGGPKNECFAS